MADPYRVNVNSGIRPIPEVIRDLIAEGLSLLSKDAEDSNGYLVKELFSFYGEDVANTVREYLIKHKSIPVVLSWPREGLGIPQICVVTVSDEEDVASDLLGDRTTMAGSGFFSEGVGTQLEDSDKVGSGPIVQREQKGYTQKITLSVFIRTEDPVLCIYLANIVRLLVFMNKLRLIEYVDYHNVVISMTDVAHNPDLFPEFAYTKQMTLRGDSYFDYNLPQKVVEALDLVMLVRGVVITLEDTSLPTAVKAPYST